MKEFGSDFHFVSEFNSNRAHLTDIYRNAYLMANGRQCIVALARQEGWRRIWVPEYFCYEVIESVRQQTGIEMVFYPDHPMANDRAIVKSLPYLEGDVLLRMNYFGIRDQRSETDIPVPVIEDHTHDLLGHWSLYSDADWCIASLRKSFPLPEGGVIWSPKGHRLTIIPDDTKDNQQIADIRWKAMQMKRDYLNGKLNNKEEYRKLFLETEGWFDTAEPSLIDERSKNYIDLFDLNAWNGAKRRNWKLLCSLLSDKVQIVNPENDFCTLFSFVLLFESMERRNRIRTQLIDCSVYPAILWQVPETTTDDVKEFSRQMLSIHCDARYSVDDVRQLADIINKAIDS